jgi:hypothetical protein
MGSANQAVPQQHVPESPADLPAFSSGHVPQQVTQVALELQQAFALSKQLRSSSCYANACQASINMTPGCGQDFQQVGRCNPTSSIAILHPASMQDKLLGSSSLHSNGLGFSSRAHARSYAQRPRPSNASSLSTATSSNDCQPGSKPCCTTSLPYVDGFFLSPGNSRRNTISPVFRY